jgi:hypothetical protein
MEDIIPRWTPLNLSGMDDGDSTNEFVHKMEEHIAVATSCRLLHLVGIFMVMINSVQNQILSNRTEDSYYVAIHEAAAADAEEQRGKKVRSES